MHVVDILAELDSQDFEEAWMLAFRMVCDDLSPSEFNRLFSLVWQIARC